MFRKVKQYRYRPLRLVCYYHTFLHNEAPIKLFTERQRRRYLLRRITERQRRRYLLRRIGELQEEMETLYTEECVFNYFYEYNACRRFLAVYRKLVERWYWLFPLVRGKEREARGKK